MDAERDAIKFDVINRLNWHYRQKHLQFQAIDLRIGINTENASEEESENIVLDVCLGNIEKSRPFFIALIGDRYGWIPPVERWEEIVGRLSAEKRQLLAGSRNCSVTEMEILYGAIGADGRFLNHSLFFFRDKKSYEGIPEDILKTYKDAEDKHHSEKVPLSTRTEALKKKILKITWENDMEDACIDYILKWNNDKKCFDNTDSFADMAFERLCHEIDKEIEINEPIQQWQQQEALSVETHIASLAADKVRIPIVEQTTERLAKGGAQILLTGNHGSGKSVAFSLIQQDLQQKNDCFCLTAFACMTDHSQRMSDILKRWIFQLEDHLSLPITGDEHLSSLSTEALSARLATLTNNAKEAGMHIVFMIDGIERFSNTEPHDVYLAWLSDDADFLGTAAMDEHLVTIHHRKMSSIDITEEMVIVLPQIIRSHEVRQNIEIPKAVKRNMNASRWFPMYVSLLMKIYANFSANDFMTIRSFSEKSEIQKINSYMENLYDEVRNLDLPELFQFAVRFVMNRIHAGEQVVRALHYISLSGGGLTEQELEHLIGKNWDVLRFHKLMTIFSDCFTEDLNTHRWNYSSPQLRYAIKTDEPERKTLYDDMAKLLLTYEDDNPQKRALLFYCLIEAENARLGRELLTSRTSGHDHWWDISLSYLIQDKALAKHINNLCRNFDSRERAGFSYALYDSLPIASQLLLLCQIESDLLQSITPSELDVPHSYGMGNYYGHLFSHHKQKYSALSMPQGDLQKAPYYLERSISFYKHCYHLDPEYSDVRNLLRAMMSEMLPIIAKEGDFSRIEAYNEEIDNIS